MTGLKMTNLLFNSFYALYLLYLVYSFVIPLFRKFQISLPFHWLYFKLYSFLFLSSNDSYDRSASAKSCYPLFSRIKYIVSSI